VTDNWLKWSLRSILNILHSFENKRNFLILQKSWKFFGCELKDEEIITIPNASEDFDYNMTEETDTSDEEYVITDVIISFPRLTSQVNR
jgi:hypothetical protein